MWGFMNMDGQRIVALRLPDNVARVCRWLVAAFVVSPADNDTVADRSNRESVANRCSELLISRSVCSPHSVACVVRLACACVVNEAQMWGVFELSLAYQVYCVC